MDEKTVYSHSQVPMGDESYYPEKLTGGWELIELMSEEEDGQTLLVKNRSDGRLCVAKCYLPESLLFERTEPKALQDLHSPLLPAFVEEIRDPKMRCILREYIAGQNLAEAAKTRDFTEQEVIRTGISLCDQLQLLHTLDPPVIHRDIKPENVILRTDGEVSLIDFGIAGEYKQETGDTVLLGTKGFAPPEQYGFSRTDVRSDIYALGKVLAWLCAAGKDNPPEISPEFDRVISKCTAFDPQNRYENVMQVKKALQETGPDSRRKKSKPVVYAGIAAAMLLLLTASLFMWRRASRQHVRFTEPLVEEAVRKNLGLTDESRLRRSDLPSVTGVYIVADRAFAAADEFYAAVNEMYADGGIIHGPVSSLEDLAQLTGLEQVCIAAEELTDIGTLGELELLNKVEIKHNYVEDISPLAGMMKLTSVGINDNPVKDISPLAQCPNLAFLDLCNVRSYDPAVIGELGNFDYLDLSNPTDSYRYLSGKSILSLHLAWTGLASLDDLDEVTRLEELDIAHTDVTDLTGLAKHTGLKRVNLAGLAVKSLEVLNELPQLESVTVSRDMAPITEELADAGFQILTE